MKKIVSILVAVLVVFSMFAITASAANAPTITATANVSSAKVGDTVKVTVSTSANSKLCALTVDLEFDADSFEFLEKNLAKNEDELYLSTAGAFPMEDINNKPGWVRFVGATGSKVKDSVTTLFTFEFKVLKTGADIKVVVAEAYVLDGENEVNVTADIATKTVTFGCPHANKEDSVTKAPTCTEAGEKTVKCKDCGATVGTESVPATGHNFADAVVKVEPTCTEKGLEEGTCTVCNAVTQKEIPALGHDYDVKVTDPTCTEKGLKESTCKVCQATVKEEIPTADHKYGEKIVVTAATATKDGKFKRVCSVCGHEKFGVINKTGSSSADLNDPNTGVSLTFAFAAAGLALATGTVVRRKRK